jgi:opacity protein-like surface antigen
MPMLRAELLTAALMVAMPIAACAAQSTGSPVFQAPYRAFARSEFGISLSEPSAGFDLEGSYRSGFTRTVDLGFRAGIHSGPGPDSQTDALLGADLRARLVTHTESFPLDASATVGLGIQSGHGVTVGRLPIGLSMGRRVLIEGSEISLVPYIQPVLTLLFGDESGTDFSLGFGVDARVTPRLDLRFSAAVGNTSGIGFTAAFLH